MCECVCECVYIRACMCQYACQCHRYTTLMFANIEDQLLTFTAESSSAMEGDCARLLYCTSADIEQRTSEAQDPGMNISARYVLDNN